MEHIRLALTGTVADLDELPADDASNTPAAVLVVDIGGDLCRVTLPWALRLAAKLDVGTPVGVELVVPLQASFDNENRN
ncbi:MAG: hypothetical protein U1F64_01380 [Burkholderiales bacterium]